MSPIIDPALPPISPITVNMGSAGGAGSEPSSSGFASPTVAATPAAEHCPFDFSRTAAARLGSAPHTLTVELRPPQFTEETFELYYRYNVGAAWTLFSSRRDRFRLTEVLSVLVGPQTEIHGSKPEDNTTASYTRHLVTSPLMPEPARVATFGATVADIDDAADDVPNPMELLTAVIQETLAIRSDVSVFCSH